MNHDDPNPNLNPLIDPELEARIVAWVAGEASPFEIAELTRLVDENPELGIFKRRMEAVHGLATGAVRPDKEPLRLSEERRAKLLQALGAPENKSASAASTKVIVPTFAATKQAHRKDRQWLLALAACLTVGLFTTLTFQTLRHSYGKGTPWGLPESDSKEKAAFFELVAGSPPESQGRLSIKENSENQKSVLEKEAAYKQQVQQLAQSSKTEADELIARRSNRAGGLSPSFAPPQIATFSYYPAPAVSSGSHGLPALSDSASPAPVASKQYVRGIDAADLDQAFADTAHYSSGKNSVYDHYIRNENPVDKSNANQLSAKPWGGAVAPLYNGNEKSELHPFFVASNDSGYAANSTLAGTRLNTDLKDSASAITVVTKQFLDDTAAKNSESLLAYTTGPEMAGVRGNYEAPMSSAAPTVETDSVGGKLPTRFAIRVAALRDDEQYERNPSFTNPNYPLISPNANSLGINPKAPALSAVGIESAKSITAGFEALSKPTSPAQAFDDDVKKSNENHPLAPSLPKPAPIASPVETNASKEPFSTFSLHVSDVSFRLAQAALANNEAIDPARICPEEFYNAFSYGDPTPTVAEKVSCRVEQAAHPFLQQRNLVRIALKVAASGRDAAQPLHLTILLDTSGSMEREDRAAIVHRAMETLISLLGPNDRITLIGFARQSALLAESLSGDQSHQLLDIINRIPAQGGTNLEEALKLGSELARRQFEPSAQNRIVLLTDGAANLGNADPALLAASIEQLRQQGIAFDACGVGLEGLDDAMLEQLTRKGDGRYYVLNSPEAADTGFAHQLAGAFRPAAENVKLQVRFNPARVGNYRLIGFEQHRLREEDFRNDSVDAAELAAEEAAVAVYQVEPLPQGEGELGEVYVRFRDAASGQMVERSWTLSYDPQSPAFDRATPSMQLAGTAALLAEKMRGGQNGDAVKLSDLAPVVAKLRSHYANEPRVQELVTMFEQLRRQTGE